MLVGMDSFFVGSEMEANGDQAAAANSHLVACLGKSQAGNHSINKTEW